LLLALLAGRAGLDTERSCSRGDEIAGPVVSRSGSGLMRGVHACKEISGLATARCGHQHAADLALAEEATTGTRLADDRWHVRMLDEHEP
jgi:hypothetical protein